MSSFVFESYSFNKTKSTATFHYSAGDRKFSESLAFSREKGHGYNEAAFERALFLAFVIVGTSYFKTFPSHDVVFRSGAIDHDQAEFLNLVYQEGMSQFAFENALTRKELAHFEATTEMVDAVVEYEGKGILALQSGGKDSLLSAALLRERDIPFTPVYVTSGATHPAVLDELSDSLVIVKRTIDTSALKAAEAAGGLNGHVPVTYIVLAIATLQAILLGKKTVLVSIGHEGEEPHARIGDLSVTHQWSKTWPAEQLFAAYVRSYISPSLQVGSPLRSLSEFRISQLFAERAWGQFGHSFSSCNLANYTQGADNHQLTWCGACPKCANAFLLFAPFVAHDDLTELFNGQDLFAKPELGETFKGLLGIDGVMKPFECIGEIDELRYAYHLSESNGYARLPFAVPESEFDITKTYEMQSWARELLSVDPGTM